MIKAKSLGLTEVVHFKEAFLEITNGLHIVRGHNKSSKSKNQSNAAGKSLLFSPIANILVGAPPIQGKKKSKNDLLSKDSCAYLEFFTHNKKHIEIYQYNGRYDIFEDEQDLDIRTVSKAEKQIRDYFPLNEQEFYSTCYLTTQQHMFQVASPNDRLKFISDLFRLHDYDILKKHFTQKLRQIKDTETEHRTLQSEYLKTEQMLKKVEWSESNDSDLDDARKKLEILSSKLKGVQSELLKYSRMGVSYKLYQALQKKLKILGKVKDPETKLKKLKQIKQQCDAHEEYTKSYKTYKTNSSNLKNELKEINSSFSIEEASILLKNSVKEFETLRERLNFIEEQKDEYESIVEQRLDITESLKSIKLVETDEEGLTERMYAAQALLNLKSLIKDCKNVKCPTCQSDFEVANLKKIVSKAQSDYEYCSIQLKGLKLKKNLDKLIVPKYDEQRHIKLKSEYKDYRTYVTTCEKQVEDAKHKQSLINALSKIEEPEFVEEPEYDSDDIENQIENTRQYMRLCTEIEEFIESNPIEDDYDAEIEQTLQKKFDSLSRTLNQVHETINLLENSKSEYLLLSSNLEDIGLKLKTLSTEIEDRKIIESLVSAYGPKGLKVNVINNLCANLEANFNTLASLIYNENFTFEFNVDASGIDVIVHRPKGLSSDVRMLSGAESDGFRLLFLSSLLPLMPEDRRTNFIVLDEPSSHMDPISKDKFIHDFIPHLKTVVPSIYILEPQPDFYPEARNLLVVKDKGICTLIEDTRQY